MTRRLRRSDIGLLLALLVAAVGLLCAGGASASVTFTPCAGAHGLGCAKLAVPLDHAGTVPGTIRLTVRRLLAGSTPSTDAVIGLAGGPGQAAAPLTREFQQMIRPALKTRDLIVFDQRGTGDSDPLSCAALEISMGTPQSVAHHCALQLGAKRAFFTTSESVDDIESIRQALGYQKLVLFGVSYGTKVALEYAERYPQNVEALVLDSVVLVNGPDPLERSTLAAIPGIVRRLCAGGACAQIGSDPVGQLAALVRRMSSGPLRGHVFDGRGHRVEMSMGRDDLLALIVGGDLDPVLRAELPGSVAAALHGDPDPLLRLNLLAEGLAPDALDGAALAHAARAASAPGAARLPAGDGEAESFDNALYVDTSCEEEPFPWQPRQATPVSREVQAANAVDDLSNAQVYPFDRSTALTAENIPTCLEWPVASAPPPSPGALPDVPTLIVSGAADTRTPTSDARKVLAQIPGAQLLVVPNVGHSTIASDPTNCTSNALRSFFATHRVGPCSSSRNPYPPTPLPPTNLSKVAPAAGVGGRAGRTLAAMQATLVDLRLELIGAELNAEALLPGGSRFGGLRGGSALFTSAKTVVLDGISYVPGVTLSGTLAERLLTRHHGPAATIVIGGPAGSDGTVRLSAGNHASGDLDGTRFNVTLASEASTSGVALYPSGLAPEPGLAHTP